MKVILPLIPLLFAGLAPAETSPAAPATAVSKSTYVIIYSKPTAESGAEWKNVISALQQKHELAGRSVILQELAALDEDSIAAALQPLKGKGRYAAVVARPEEVSRVLFRDIHRAVRRVDADPWGDCLCGVVTGRTPEDALRIAKAEEPLVMKRLLATTNVDASRFEHSYCITDWSGAPVMAQTGYTEPQQTLYTRETPEGQAVLNAGLQTLFARQLEEEKPQLIITSSHATQFNLEMPFSIGAILPSGGYFYQASPEQFSSFGHTLRAAYMRQPLEVSKWVSEKQLKPIQPDAEPRIWLAAGNCLFGDAYNTADSMSMTALSTYTCNQVVGYTVPSWYGEGGWGTMGTLLGNAEGTSLAEAWFLNNQFILHRTQKIHPALLSVEFNAAEISGSSQYKMVRDIEKAGIPPQVISPVIKDCFGLVHDRDVVAFYGDPTWRAMVNESNTKPAFKITWHGSTSFTISSEKGAKARIGILFPESVSADQVSGCDAQDAVFTNDFILFESLELAPGASRTVNLQFK